MQLESENLNHKVDANGFGNFNLESVGTGSNQIPFEF